MGPAEIAARYVSSGQLGMLRFAPRIFGTARARVELGKTRLPVPFRPWNDTLRKTGWYPLTIARTFSDFCLSGGQFLGQLPLTIGWHDSKGHGPDPVGDNSAGILVDAARATVEGVYLANQHDAIRVRSRSRDAAPAFLLTGNWLEYTRDDCIEADDSLASGRIEGNFFDGCYTFFSIRAGSRKSAQNQPSREDLTIDISDNLIRMEPMPYPYKWQSRDTAHHLQVTQEGGMVPHGHGPLFKLNRDASINPRFAFDGNTILLQKLRSVRLLRFPAPELIRSCAGNTIVWAGAEPLEDVRAALETPEPCEIRLTDDPAVWHRAVADWLAAHPRFAGYTAPHAPGSYALPRTGTGYLQ